MSGRFLSDVVPRRSRGAPDHHFGSISEPRGAHWGGPGHFFRFLSPIGFYRDLGVPQARARALKKRGGGMRDLTSGDLVKRHILRKAQLNTRENVIPATLRKRGPLGKGDY